MAAFRAAIEADVGIECDLRLSRDGFAMVFHDESLERLCGQSVLTRSLYAAALMQMPLAGSDQRIPWLGELLQLVDGRVPLLLELKSEPGVELLCAAVACDLRRYRGPCAVMSFDARVGRWFAEHMPDVRRGIVIGADESPLERWFKLRISRAQLAAVETDLVETPWAQTLRLSGMPLLTWTVRSAERRKALADQVDALIWEADGRP